MTSSHSRYSIHVSVNYLDPLLVKGTFILFLWLLLREKSSFVASDDEDNILPVNEYESQIIESVKSHQVVILTGETGSGKSTQIPQILYRNGFEWMIHLMHRFLKKGGIAISQPRRVAATNLARRVCDEMHFTLGKEVGYTIRYFS